MNTFKFKSHIFGMSTHVPSIALGITEDVFQKGRHRYRVTAMLEFSKKQE